MLEKYEDKNMKFVEFNCDSGDVVYCTLDDFLKACRLDELEKINKAYDDYTAFVDEYCDDELDSIPCFWED